MADTISQALQPVFLALLTALAGYAAQYIKKYVSAKHLESYVNYLSQITKIAVTAAEQKDTTGKSKKDYAVDYVNTKLSENGFSTSDVVAINNAVEAAFLKMKPAFVEAYNYTPTVKTTSKTATANVTQLVEPVQTEVPVKNTNDGEIHEL